MPFPQEPIFENITVTDTLTIGATGQIISSNYVPGVSGFRLDGATGSAELNDAVIRGDVIAGTAGAGPRIEVRADFDGFGNPYLALYDPARGEPALIGLDGGALYMSGPYDIPGPGAEVRIDGEVGTVEIGVTSAVTIDTASSAPAGTGVLTLFTDQLYLGDPGTEDVLGAWTAYSPSNTNVTVGNGIQTARYQRIGKLCVVRYSLAFGSTTAFTGTATIGLPFTANAGGSVAAAGWALDSGTRNYVAGARLGAGASDMLAIHTEAGGLGFINATNPMTWTTGDALVLTVVYEIA